MRSRPVRTFVEEFLAFHGATVEARGDRLLEVHSPRKVAQVLGASQILLAFDAEGLQEDPRSELGTVGNPVFDRIVELARSCGRAGERYAPAPRDRPAPPDPAQSFRFPAGSSLSGPEPVYTPLYFLLFRVEYSLEDAADELEVVPVDGATLQTLGQTPELGDFWEGLAESPAAGRTVHPAFPVPRPVVGAALRFLEKRLRRRLGKLRREAEGHLERETRSIEGYYQQLIEETRNAGRRWMTTPEGREEKIRLLQLDWKRRIEEAQQAWRPTVETRLSAVAAAQRPRQEFLVWPDGSSGKPAGKARSRALAAEAGRLWWDEADRAFVLPPCRSCGTVAPIEWTPASGGFLCPRCALERGAGADRTEQGGAEA